MFLTAVMLLIGRDLTSVIGESKRAEAELRAVGAHLRESGEARGVPDGSMDGRRLIARALQEVIVRWLAICWQLMRMTLVSHTNLLLAPVAGIFLCTPKYLAGTMTLGEVVQAGAAFAIVQTAFNWITESYARLAEWISSANRVASLLLALDQIDDPERLKGLSLISSIKDDELAARPSPGTPN